MNAKLTLEGLCDDTLARVISFCDFKSAIAASTLTSHRIRSRIATVSSTSITSDQQQQPSSGYEGRCFQQLWKHFYQRQYFPPLDFHKEDPTFCVCKNTITDGKSVGGKNLDYIELCQEKRMLFHNLMMQRRSRGKNEKRSRSSATKSNSASKRIKGWTKLKSNSCFSIPNRCFHFVPITPSIDLQDDDRIHTSLNPDAPPVDFQCTSYMLTSISTGSEYVFLDPFDGSLSVRSDILCKAAKASDYELDLKRHLALNMSNDSAAEEIVQSNNVKREEKFEMLFGVEDYFALDLNEYFQRPALNHHHSQNLLNSNQRLPIQLAQDDEIEIGWMGIDSYPIIDSEGNMVGNLVLAARELCVDQSSNLFRFGNHLRRDDHDTMGGNIKSCTELLAWKKDRIDGDYKDERFTCRLDGTPYFMEVCAAKEIVFACFSPGSSDPYDNGSRIGNLMDNDDDAEMDDNGFTIQHNHQIHAFPLMKHSNAHKGQGRQYFPNVQQTLVCSSPVTSFISETAGRHLIVGTENGGVEIWNVEAKAYLVERLDVKSMLKNLSKSRPFTTIRSENTMFGTNQIGSNESELETEQYDSGTNIDVEVEIDTDSCSDMFSSEDEDMGSAGRSNHLADHRVRYASALDHLNETMQNEIDVAADHDEDQNAQMHAPLNISQGDIPMEQSDVDTSMSLSQCKLDRAVNQVYLPKHLTIHQAGFVTIQHHKSEGTTLMLWQYANGKGTESFYIASMVNLPLSTQRRPQVAYDGKRLVVFGQDHIGLIILVYRVTR